jgi:hypothetical protein
MVAKRDDAAAGGFRFEPWVPVDEADMFTDADFKNARDELRRLINNLVYSRPEDERPALLAAGDRLLLHDDQTVADLLATIKTAMVAARPSHSKDDHQKRRRDRRKWYETMKHLDVDFVANEAGIDPDQRLATKEVGRAMDKRRKNEGRAFPVLPGHDIRRGLKKISRHRKSKPTEE